MNQTPTVGRIVHYKSRGSADGVFPSVPRAAIVSDVREKISSGVQTGIHEVKLTVFNPEGLFFTDWLTQGDAPGNWNWPPIV